MEQFAQLAREAEGVLAQNIPPCTWGGRHHPARALQPSPTASVAINVQRRSEASLTSIALLDLAGSGGKTVLSQHIHARTHIDLQDHDRRRYVDAASVSRATGPKAEASPLQKSFVLGCLWMKGR